MKGRTERFTFHHFMDPDTGVKVTRLTPPDAVCIRNYFYQKAFTGDGRRLVFGSNLDGPVNIWLLDLETGETVQLTEGEGDFVQGCYLSPDDRFLYFTRQRSVHIRLDLETLKEEAAYRIPEGWSGYGTWQPDDECSHAAGIEMWTEDRVPASGGWDQLALQFARKPRMRLIDIDLGSGAARTVFEDRLFIGHPMFRPQNTELMGFCHEGPHDLVDSRIWLVNRDGTGLRRVKEHAQGESCMHEFWIPDGSRLLYVSYFKGRQERDVRAFDPQSGADEALMSIPPCAHLMSNRDGSLLVGDGAGHLGDVADKASYSFQPDPHIYLFDVGRKSFRAVCRHDSTWAVHLGNRQASHPHPSFTPDERSVYFASDVTGKPALYLAELGGRGL